MDANPLRVNFNKLMIWSIKAFSSTKKSEKGMRFKKLKFDKIEGIQTLRKNSICRNKTFSSSYV